MLRSTELDTLGMIDTTYRDLLCRATGNNLSIKGRGNFAAILGFVTTMKTRWKNVINQPSYYVSTASDFMHIYIVIEFVFLLYSAVYCL